MYEYIDNINEGLQKAQEGMLHHQKIVSMLEDLREQRKALADKVQKLKEQLDKEDLDVANLEGKSLSHLFYSVLGNLDKKLEKEREEALAARLKYDQASEDLKNVEAEIIRLEAEETANRKWEDIYQRLYNEKREQLIESGSKTGEEILNLSQRITTLKNYAKEIKEAIEAGEAVMIHLKSAEESLESAKGWGTWDLLGGGLIADLAKHSHIDDAKEAVSKAQKKMINFRSELADVKMICELSIDISDFAKFADFFFDGLLADWHMQSKISNSLDSVSKTKDRINKALIKLKTMERETMSNIRKAEEEINRLITNA